MLHDDVDLGLSGLTLDADQGASIPGSPQQVPVSDAESDPDDVPSRPVDNDKTLVLDVEHPPAPVLPPAYVIIAPSAFDHRLWHELMSLVLPQD
jgi:hypothetical protein